MEVVGFVDKVRINPGNFVDKRAVFKTIEYTEESYSDELEKIDRIFGPFIEKCIKLKKSIRIGTNHGSLSDRIMSWYGDTPKGMVESALEFTRVARKYDFHDIIYSMKASNPVVMIEAYRLLVHEMQKLGWDYPLHLGVTEAGNGEDGRIKSAIGTGALLLDGIGDTIRVSLTEDPWYEIEPCRQLIAFAEEYAEKGPDKPFTKRFYERPKIYLKEWMHPDGSVVLSVSEEEILSESFFEGIGCKVQLGQPERTISTVDALLVSDIGEAAQKKIDKCRNIGIAVMPEQRFVTGQHHDIRKRYQERKEPIILDVESDTDPIIRVSSEMGGLLADGIGEGICLRSNKLTLKERHSISFGILQGCRMRSFKTEFIACPSCGRTLFDLQSVTEKIRARTSHLPGVKIAIMGCIVNGPGEMADADFGYVGSKAKMIDLYVGKERVKKSIPEEEAVDHLIELIKEHGRWIEPEVEEVTV